MYYNEKTIVFYNGAFMKATEACGNVYDQSLHYGYGVFEGLRAYDTDKGTRIFKALEHYRRMQASCEAIGMPYPFNNDELVHITYEVLEKNNFRNAYIRPLVTASPNMSLTKGKEAQLLIAAWEWNAYLGEKLLRLKTSSYRRISASSFKVEAKVTGHYVNSILAAQEARDAGYDEALLLDGNGFIAEGPGANIFFEQDGVLLTPERGSILPGITRATVMEICRSLNIEVTERKLLPGDIAGADSAFYCGTAAEIVGIHSLDDIAFSKPWEGSLGATIQQVYRDLVMEKTFKKELNAA
jgi:branched-chain amino acid aminotransferase